MVQHVHPRKCLMEEMQLHHVHTASKVLFMTSVHLWPPNSALLSWQEVESTEIGQLT